jgi:prepilin-type N-terminal cleavage/methylation domain-containing protein
LNHNRVNFVQTRTEEQALLTNGGRNQAMTTTSERSPAVAGVGRDAGFTIVELLTVIVILGVLGGITLLALSGMAAEAAATGCRADRQTLSIAAEAYLAQHDADAIPPTGVDADRYERTLVDAGLLRSTSPSHQLTPDGTVLIQETSSC